MHVHLGNGSDASGRYHIQPGEPVVVDEWQQLREKVSLRFHVRECARIGESSPKIRASVRLPPRRDAPPKAQTRRAMARALYFAEKKRVLPVPALSDNYRADRGDWVEVSPGSWVRSADMREIRTGTFIANEGFRNSRLQAESQRGRGRGTLGIGLRRRGAVRKHRGGLSFGS